MIYNIDIHTNQHSLVCLCMFVLLPSVKIIWVNLHSIHKIFSSSNVAFYLLSTFKAFTFKIPPRRNLYLGNHPGQRTARYGTTWYCTVISKMCIVLLTRQKWYFCLEVGSWQYHKLRWRCVHMLQISPNWQLFSLVVSIFPIPVLSLSSAL